MAKLRVATKVRVVAVMILAVWLSACKTSREVVKFDARPMGTAKLLKKVEQNAFDYQHFSIKRIGTQFTTNDSKATFKINLKAIKNEAIQVSISKLNIPVGRVLLTPDSVKYVNYLDRNYFVDDYSYLSGVLNIDLDFSTIQSIISNNAFSYRNDPKDKDFKTFNSSVENGLYLLQSEKERKVFRMDEKGKTGKIERRLKRLDDDALILQKMYFNPVNFALTKLLILDKTNDRKMEMDFSDFVEVENKDYPGAIEMNFNSAENNVGLKIRMSGFSNEKFGALKINIPDKYERIKVD